MQPLVSVVISTRNREKYIKRAIESALNQTYKNIEVIVINDASVDATSKVIATVKHQRVVVLENKVNLGFPQSLNKGIFAATGKYIARLDDDDYWIDSAKIEKQVNFLETHPEYVLTGGGIIKIDKQGKELTRRLLPETDEKVRKSILLGNPFVHSTVVFAKNAWEKAGRYDQSVDYCNDWDLWLKLGKLGKYYNFQEYFVHYLQWEDNWSNNNVFGHLKTDNKIREKYRNDYPGFAKAIFLGRLKYLYYFLPCKDNLYPIAVKLKKILYGF